MDNRIVFVCTPGDKSKDDRYKDLCETAILPPLRRLHRMVPMVYYDHPQSGKISDTILTNIDKCNLLVAVISGENPNVMVEIGMAMGLGKPVLTVTSTAERTPILISQWNPVRYNRKQPDVEKISKDVYKNAYNLLYKVLDPVRGKELGELLQGKAGEAWDPDPLGGRTTNDLFSGGAGKQSGGGRKGWDYNLKDAKEDYEKNDFVEVVVRLCHRYKTIDSAEVLFYLADSLFLLAERMVDESARLAVYGKLLDVTQYGLKHFKDNNKIIKLFGNATMELDRLPLAETTFNQLLLSGPFMGVAWYNLACICSRRRDAPSTIKMLEEAFTIDSDYRYVARVDPDFDWIWRNPHFQRILYPLPR